MVLCAFWAVPALAQCENPVGGYPGFGQNTTGGAGRQVVQVTNLNNSGPGSLRAAIGSNRCIVFTVGGTINLESDLRPSAVSNMTVDGFTAPSPGITIAGYAFRIQGASNNVVVRGLRRRGSASLNTGIDGFACWQNSTNIVFSHLSVDGFSDEGFDTSSSGGCDNVLIQYSIVGTGANPNHNYGALLSLGAQNNTFYRNLMVNTNLRNPACDDVNNCEIVNNLVWGYTNSATRVGSNAIANVVGNYYYSPNFGHRPDRAIEVLSNAVCYGTGNYAHSSMSITGAQIDAQCVRPARYNHPAVPTLPAVQAACEVVASAGARGPAFGLDARDQSYINSVTLNSTCSSNPSASDNSSSSQGDTSTHQAGPSLADLAREERLRRESQADSADSSDPAPPAPDAPVSPLPTDGADATPPPPAAEEVNVPEPPPPVGQEGSAMPSNPVAPAEVEAPVLPLPEVPPPPAQAGGTSGSTPVVPPLNTPPAVSVPLNQAPLVHAGSDVTVSLPASIHLNGQVSDDGAPDGHLTVSWSQVSGPGAAVFADAASVVTTAVFPAAGTYVLRLWASDRDLASSDDLVVTVRPASGPGPQSEKLVYIATNGNDANAGTEASPYRTLKKAFENVRAGDSIIIRGGIYGESIRSFDMYVPSGESWAKPITVRGAPGEVVTLRPGTPGGVINLVGDYSYLIFKDLVMDAVLTPGSAGARFADGAHHNRLDAVEIRNVFGGSGVVTTGRGSDFNEFINVNVHSTKFSLPSDQYHGIELRTSSNLIDGGTFHNNRYGYGILLHGAMEAHRNVVRNARSYDNYGGMAIGGGQRNDAYNNIFHDNINHGVSIGSGAVDTVLNINIVAGAGNHAVQVQPNARNTEIRNNIFWGNAVNGVRNQGVGTVMSHNLTVNPLFADPANRDFRLRADSPAVDAGISVSGVGADIDGMPRPQGSGYDIGPYER